MAFTVRKIAYRPWPITVTLMEADAAGVVHEVENTFIGHFGAFSEDEFEKIMKASESAVPAPTVPGVEAMDVKDVPLPISVVLRRNAAIFSHVLVGWGQEVRDEHGASIPYSEETLFDLVTGPDGRAVSIGINAALAQIRFGVAPQKNVETSPAPGPETGAGETAQTT